MNTIEDKLKNLRIKYQIVKSKGDTTMMRIIEHQANLLKKSAYREPLQQTEKDVISTLFDSEDYYRMNVTE